MIVAGIIPVPENGTQLVSWPRCRKGVTLLHRTYEAAGGARAANHPCDHWPTGQPPIRRHVLRVSGALDARGDAVRGPSPDRIVRHQEPADTMHTRFFQTKPNSSETVATAGPRDIYDGYPTPSRRPTCILAGWLCVIAHPGPSGPLSPPAARGPRSDSRSSGTTEK